MLSCNSLTSLTLKSGFKNYSYLTEQEKASVRRLSAEAFFSIGLALLGLMMFGFDPEDDEKWKKLRAKSGALNQDTFNTFGFLSNHMLLLAMGVQAETSAFIPLPTVKGINFGADDYVKMITHESRISCTVFVIWIKHSWQPLILIINKLTYIIFFICYGFISYQLIF